MKENRKNIILSEIENEPNNPFNYYLLGLEWISQNNKEEVQKTFEFLLTNHPNYLPSYIIYANYLIENQLQIDSIEMLINKGISVAEVQHNTKAQSELQALIDLHF